MTHTEPTYTAVATTPRGQKAYSITEREARGHAHTAERAIRAMAAEDAGCAYADVILGRLRLEQPPRRIIDVPVTELVVGLVVDGFGTLTHVYHRAGTITVYADNIAGDGIVKHYVHEQHTTAPVWVDAPAGGRSALATPTGRRVLVGQTVDAGAVPPLDPNTGVYSDR